MNIMFNQEKFLNGTLPQGEVYTREHVVEELERYVQQFPTQEAAARHLDISRVFLWRVLNKRQPPSAKVLQKLGFVKEARQLEFYLRGSKEQAA